MSATMVTGGLGYCGRHVVDQLHARGENVVSYNRDYAEATMDGVTLVQGELYDIPRLLQTIRDHSVEQIVHTAAMSHPDLSIEFPIATFQANVDGTVNLFEAARLAGVHRIVYFSSETVYGHIDGTVREEAPLHPTTPYGVTKVTGELLADVYTRLYEFDAVSLRFSEVYGPGNKMPTALRDMLLAAVHGQSFRMPDGGDHRFQFIHVNDVARATVCALDCAAPAQRVFNITGGSQVSLSDAAALVRSAVPGADIEVGPGFWHLDRQGEWDISAAERELGYTPRVALADGIASYSAWLRQHPY
ncbi:MAG: NAD-dependent epimerase/dehydratase family protein [Gaiellaceae bacterium]